MLYSSKTPSGVSWTLICLSHWHVLACYKTVRQIISPHDSSYPSSFHGAGKFLIKVLYVGGNTSNTPLLVALLSACALEGFSWLTSSLLASGLNVLSKVVPVPMRGRGCVVRHWTDRLLYGMGSYHLYSSLPREELKALKTLCLLSFRYRLLWYLKNSVPKCRTFVSWVNSAVHF